MEGSLQKRWYPTTSQYGVITQTTATGIIIAVETSDLATYA